VQDEAGRYVINRHRVKLLTAMSCVDCSSLVI